MRQKAVIIDIDGTLANSQNPLVFTNSKGETDWPAWIASTAHAPVNEWCKQLTVAMYRQGYRLIFLTARGEHLNGRALTKNWLNNTLNIEGIFEYELLMRPEGDLRPDIDLKLTIYSTLIAPNFDVAFAVDDKQSVVDLWRNLGLPALHCADY
jgi:hypothetical protein